MQVTQQPPVTALLLAALVTLAPCHNCEAQSPPVVTKPRLLVTTDIGGDPDDTQSLIRLMVYANEFRLEGLVASASGTVGELKESITQPNLIKQVVNAYGEVRPQLVKHASGWPTQEELTSLIVSGNPHRGPNHIGEHHDTDGSRLIINRVDAGSPHDPLNISIWGGQTDLAQALWRVRSDRGLDGLADFVKKFRVYDINDQDSIAAWMKAEFPGMNYILSKAPDGQDKRLGAYRGMYLTGDESLTSRDWIEKNILAASPLGSLYPTKTWTAPNPHGCLKEGDTPSWFFFLPAGGNDPNDPTKPGWGGQFRKDSSGWYRDIKDAPRETVSRWRNDFQTDFAKRMSWTRAK